MYVTAAFGNPILDLIVNISDDKLLKKYGFKEDDQYEVTAEVLQSLYKETEKLPRNMSAGGCAQNTMRVLQWLLRKQNQTIFFGGVGNDEQGRLLKEIVEKAGVTTKYTIYLDESTATCIGFSREWNRTLIVHLGAAECYKTNALKPNDLETLRNVQIIYIEGFFLTKRLEVARYVKNFAIEHKRLLVFNLCGSYLCDMLPEETLEFAKDCQIVFGNKLEYETLGKPIGMDALTLAEMLSKINTNTDSTNSLLRFGKIVIITHGPKLVYCVCNGNTIRIKVPVIRADVLKDVVGAGDAFAAGFLAGLILDLTLEECLKFANWTAAQIIQQVGCTIPDYEPTWLNK